ncbi:thioredoxin family protein [Polaribacter vadi]|uniref:thioredoxin family protein n=1 Tax=Polaribacter TaxID=52959 RepID=UPI001C09AD0C|nr:MULTISPECIES: thioredoxin family protein [Polaribacter]MBU3010242.1 thioredoxin family protein [Polaribacter vadi]MDO6740048.1 thioredoxin family protein [Polaribacter sp. 1_MG-2023]
MLKKIIFIFLTTIIFACNSSKSTVENKETEVAEKIVKAKEYIKVKAKNANATKNDRGYLIGFADKNSFADASYKSWFNSRYSEYNTNKEIIEKLKPIINDFTIKGFMGTWCGDSKRETPRFYKILEETGFDLNYFELVTVGRNKKTPDNLQEGYNIIRVPTFIFYKEGKEVGRYVEYPRENLEKDILKIVTGAPYKHSYDKSE